MAHYGYERLSALDSTFLIIESPQTLMHVAAAAIFEPGSLSKPDGGVDIDRITQYIDSRLHRIPRYRQRLEHVPLEGHPVWVDDVHFTLHYHVRHASLPEPGDLRQLKRLVARIGSQELDLGKPLWEMWIVEGLRDGRFGLVTKIHHCMIDGVAGTDLLSVLLSSTPESEIEGQPRWIPRPAPSPTRLLRDELAQRARAPLGLVSRLLREPAALLHDVRDGAAAMAEALGSGLRLGSDTPFNQPIGSHRRVDWTSIDLAQVHAIRSRLGGSVNDVVLAAVAAAVRRFLRHRAVAVEGLVFRAFVPVNVRGPAERGALGNRVAAWIVDLPIEERDPVKRLTRVIETTARLKQSKQAQGTEILTEVVEWTGSAVLGAAMRLATRAHPFNLVVTNVPGPRTSLYLLGARMQEIHPLVPLFVNQGLGVALFSYDERLFWGFNADWDLMPDLHDFVRAVDDSLAELRRAAETRRGPNQRPAAKTRSKARRRSA